MCEIAVYVSHSGALADVELVWRTACVTAVAMGPLVVLKESPTWDSSGYQSFTGPAECPLNRFSQADFDLFHHAKQSNSG